jgi:hypothetical protein
MPLVEDDDVVEEFPMKAANHPLHIGIFPRRARGRDDLIDTQTFNPWRNPLTDNAIAVSNEIGFPHSPDELSQLPSDLGPAGPRRLAECAPVLATSPFLPGRDRSGLDEK